MDKKQSIRIFKRITQNKTNEKIKNCVKEDNKNEKCDEDYDDFNLKKTYYEENIFKEISSMIQLLGLNNLLYLVHIWNRKLNKYFYKLGFTNNFFGRLMGLNSEYDCCGRIIPIMIT